MTEDEYVTRYVYGANGERISAEYDYAENIRPGEAGENIATRMAANGVSKICFRRSLLDSTLLAVDLALTTYAYSETLGLCFGKNPTKLMLYRSNQVPTTGKMQKHCIR